MAQPMKKLPQKSTWCPGKVPSFWVTNDQKDNRTSATVTIMPPLLMLGLIGFSDIAQNNSITYLYIKSMVAVRAILL